MSKRLLDKPNITAAVRHLTAADSVLGEFIAAHQQAHGPCPVKPTRVRSLFVPLARSIIYQQLSGKAAGTIHGRFKDLFKRRVPTATQLQNLSYEQLRAVGLSNNKALALQDLADKVVSRQLPPAARIHEYDDQEIIDQLVQVRGIGVWTVQMFLMFSLARPNVLPVADLGIQKGLQQLYRLDKLPKPEQVAEYGRKWQPWCTVAAWYLWRRTEVNE